MPPTSRCSLPRWRERYMTNRGLPSAAPPQPKGTTADVADIMNKRKKHGGLSHRLTQMRHRSERDALFICENLCSSVAQSKSLRAPEYFSLFCIRLNQRNQRFLFSGIDAFNAGPEQLGKWRPKKILARCDEFGL